MIWCLLALWHIWHVQPRIGEEITCDTCSSREAGATCEPLHFRASFSHLDESRPLGDLGQV